MVMWYTTLHSLCYLSGRRLRRTLGGIRPNGARRYRLWPCLCLRRYEKNPSRCSSYRRRDTTTAGQLMTSTLASRKSRIASQQVS